MESLAHAFDVLSRLLYDAHEVLLEGPSREACDWHAVLKGAGGRLPPCMVAQDWDRTVWLNLHDGSVLTPVEIPMEPSPEDFQKALERYPWLRNLKGKLSPSSPLQEEAVAWFEHAKNVLKADGYHLPIALIGYPDRTKGISQILMEDKTAKHLMFRKLAAEIEKTGATSIILINEAWLFRDSKSLEDSPRREEALQLIAADATGALFVHNAIFVRDSDGKITFTEEETKTTTVVNLLQPIRDVWKRRKK